MSSFHVLLAPRGARRMSGRARDRERVLGRAAFAISRPPAHSSARFQRAREQRTRVARKTEAPLRPRFLL